MNTHSYSTHKVFRALEEFYKENILVYYFLFQKYI